MRAKVVVVLTFLLFSVSSALAGTETVLYSFAGGTDGSWPYQAGVVFDQSGNLYGVTGLGGAYGWGTVFQLTPSPGGGWTENILYNFIGSPDGAEPNGGLVIDGSGNLYGTAVFGGPGGCGALFQLSPSPSGWTYTILHAFTGGNDGCDPQGDLMLIGSLIVGTAMTGGCAGQGTVFTIWTSGGGFNYGCFKGYGGNWPGGTGINCGANGYFCGATMLGGRDGTGTLFNWDWGFKLASGIFTFESGHKAGIWPVGDLASPGDGGVIGTTSAGGAGNYGTVYELTVVQRMYGWGFRAQVLHSFTGTNGDGNSPWAGVILDAAGNIYGTTQFGGTANGGIVFKLTPGAKNKWNETVLYNFSGGADGYVPTGALIFDSAGNIYGTTSEGGAYGQGTVYMVTP